MSFIPDLEDAFVKHCHPLVEAVVEAMPSVRAKSEAFCDAETVKKLGELVNLFEDDTSSPEGAKLKDSEYFYPDAPRSRKVSSGTPYIWEDADAVKKLRAAEREIERLLDSLPQPPA